MKRSKKKEANKNSRGGFWGMSKPVMGAVVVIALIVAGVVLWINTSGGGGMKDTLANAKGTMIWMKCNNPSCGEAYQIDKAEYLKYQQDHPGEVIAYQGNPPLTCEKCGEKSLLPAIKCPNCGNVFIEGEAGGKYPDECPECGHSATEERLRK